MTELKRLKRTLLLPLLLTVSLILGGCGSLPSGSPGASSQGSASLSQGDGLTLHFIDVGQGDSILAESDGHFMLIDAGENDQGDTVVSYLTSAGVQTLDYVIGTHPHSDHIGGLDDVIRAFSVEKVILPPIEHTTKTFEDVLDAISEKGLKLTRPQAGDTYSLGKAAFTILAPIGDYGDDLNNWSVGLKLTLGNRSFVMCGDAETAAETDIVNSGLDLKADVLKAGHHGSRTSTSDAFLKAVSPSYAVIQCGEGNSYGHPHKETIEKLETAGIQILRTDQLGTITAWTDGTDLSWSFEKGEAPALSPSTEETEQTASYILNEKTKKFHLPDCSSVKQMQPENRSEYSGSREQLIEEGYSPCGQCRP